MTMKIFNILLDFKKSIEYTGPLRFSENRTLLAFSSKQIGESLISQGCVPKKSLILKYPKSVPELLSWHFIRGYFDGDGCLCISGRGARWTLVGTYSFLNIVASTLNSIGVNCTVYEQKKVHVLSVSGNRQIKVLLERLYLDSTVFMTRKHEKKEEFYNLMSLIRPIRNRDRVDNYQEIIDDYKSGMKVKDIESKHNITNRTMYKILNNYNVERRQVSNSAN